MLRSLYKRRAVVLWVEDELTKEYLRALWQKDPRIGFAVAAGREGVSALTTDARSGPDQRTNVFGVQDRDFGETNFPDWADPGTVIFRLRRYEIENYLLDWDALAGCATQGLHRNADEIERRVKNGAEELVWWAACKRLLCDLRVQVKARFPTGPTQMERRVKKRAEELGWWAACKRLLSDLRVQVTGSFPADPARDKITDHGSALDYILKTNGWHGHVCGLPETSLENNSIASNLSKYHKEIKQTINAGDWPETFPGKPLFRAARGYITNLREGSKGEDDIDLAKAVADEQVRKGRQPPDLMALRDCLIKRTGLSIRSSRHP